MGLFDLPAPLLAAADQTLSHVVPAGLRLILWGLLCGWLTMLVYRRLSHQEAIAELKARQKKQQEEITRFDGDFNELMPMIRGTFSLGFRQLGLSIGPALLATVPILFIVAWVATAFVYDAPTAGDSITVSAQPEQTGLNWTDNAKATSNDAGWIIQWPPEDQSVALIRNGGEQLLNLSANELHGVIHKRHWWNWLIANPAGYLPKDVAADIVRIDLPTRKYLSFGPEWMRGSLFVFFSVFLAASIAFKLLLKID